jgi:hypothetical protein
MDHDIGHAMEISFDFILNRIGEMMSSMHVHLRINKDMKINVDVISTASAPDLVTLFDTPDGEDDFLNLLNWNRHSIAEHARALLQDIHGS